MATRLKTPAAARQRPRPAHAEGLAWVLFSAGGIVAAFVFPVHIAILGIGYAAGWLDEDVLNYERILGLVRNPLTKLYLGVIVALPLYHWAHRFRYTIHHQFGVHGARATVAAACYGTAVAGTVLTVIVLLRI